VTKVRLIESMTIAKEKGPKGPYSQARILKPGCRWACGDSCISADLSIALNVSDVSQEQRLGRCGPKDAKFQTRSKLLALGKAFSTCNIQFLLRGTEYSGCPSEVKFLAIPQVD
jgi:hypothetical protein